MPTSGDRAPETRSSAGREPGGTPISSRALSQVLPSAELRQLEGVSHNVKMNVLAPVLADFFTREADIAVGGKEGPRRYRRVAGRHRPASASLLDELAHEEVTA
jgi:hypothetical protein